MDSIFAAVGRGLQVQHMKRGTTTIMLVAITIGLATASAHAQGLGGGHKHQKQADKTDPQKRKADDKAYSAALKSLLDKPKPDPWQGARWSYPPASCLIPGSALRQT
jgi:hypothetical protein